MAAKRGGTYYLTYHRFAARKQVEGCYPRFAEFLHLKREYDLDGFKATGTGTRAMFEIARDPRQTGVLMFSHRKLMS